MLSFFESSKSEYISIAAKVEYQGEEEYLYFKNKKNASDFLNRVKKYIFPFPHSLVCSTGKVRFHFNTSDSNKNHINVFVLNTSQSKRRVAFVIVSKYYHPNFFYELLDKTSSIFKNKGKDDSISFLKSVSEYKLIQRVHDNIFTNSSNIEMQNIEHLSPQNEIDKLLRFLFTHLTAYDILVILTCIIIDYNIIIVSSNLDIMTSCVYSIIGLLYPLDMTCTINSLIIEDHMDLLSSSSPYIFGLHSSLVHTLIDNSYIEDHLFVNLDCRYAAFSNEEFELPDKIANYINITAKYIYNVFGYYKPLFPKQKTQQIIREFILSVLSYAYGEGIKNPRSFYQKYQMMQKEEFLDEYSIAEGFADMINNSSFVGNIATKCGTDDETVLKCLWPSFELRSTSNSNRRRRTHKHNRVTSSKRRNSAKKLKKDQYSKSISALKSFKSIGATPKLRDFDISMDSLDITSNDSHSESLEKMSKPARMSLLNLPSIQEMICFGSSNVIGKYTNDRDFRDNKDTQGDKGTRIDKGSGEMVLDARLCNDKTDAAESTLNKINTDGLSNKKPSNDGKTPSDDNKGETIVGFDQSKPFFDVGDTEQVNESPKGYTGAETNSPDFDKREMTSFHDIQAISNTEDAKINLDFSNKESDMAFTVEALNEITSYSPPKKSNTSIQDQGLQDSQILPTSEAEYKSSNLDQNHNVSQNNDPTELLDGEMTFPAFVFDTAKSDRSKQLDSTQKKTGHTRVKQSRLTHSRSSKLFEIRMGRILEPAHRHGSTVRRFSSGSLTGRIGISSSSLSPSNARKNNHLESQGDTIYYSTGQITSPYTYVRTYISAKPKIEPTTTDNNSKSDC